MFSLKTVTCIVLYQCVKIVCILDINRGFLQNRIFFSLSNQRMTNLRQLYLKTFVINNFCKSYFIIQKIGNSYPLFVSTYISSDPHFSSKIVDVLFANQYATYVLLEFFFSIFISIECPLAIVYQLYLVESEKMYQLYNGRVFLFNINFDKCLPNQFFIFVEKKLQQRLTLRPINGKNSYLYVQKIKSY